MNCKISPISIKMRAFVTSALVCVILKVLLRKLELITITASSSIKSEEYFFSSGSN